MVIDLAPVGRGVVKSGGAQGRIPSRELMVARGGGAVGHVKGNVQPRKRAGGGLGDAQIDPGYFDFHGVTRPERDHTGSHNGHGLGVMVFDDGAGIIGDGPLVGVGVVIVSGTRVVTGAGVFGVKKNLHTIRVPRRYRVGVERGRVADLHRDPQSRGVVGDLELGARRGVDGAATGDVRAIIAGVPYRLPGNQTVHGLIENPILGHDAPVAGCVDRAGDGTQGSQRRQGGCCHYEREK